MSGGPSLTLVRRIRASRARIWAAWTDPAYIARWWGPRAATVTDVQVDLRVGGAYAVHMRGADGTTYTVAGAYQILSPPERLVFSWSLTPGPARSSTVTMTLLEVGPDTELTLTHEGEADPATLADRRHGWTRSLKRLERWLVDRTPLPQAGPEFPYATRRRLTRRMD